MPQRYGVLHIGFLAAMGAAGWILVVGLTWWPYSLFLPWDLSWELAACAGLVTASRMLSFRVLDRARIALDSAFYIATKFVFGTIAAAWIVVIALTIDATVNVWKRQRSRASR